MLNVLMIDKDGLLNIASWDLDGNKSWAGPLTYGPGNLVPGSFVATLKLSAKVLVAMTIDRMGVLNVMSFDRAGGWQGPDTVGNSTLIPGAPISAFKQSATTCTALSVDRDGVLNVFTNDLSAQNGWLGPDTIGSANLVPGGAISTGKVGVTIFTAIMMDRNGLLNIATLDVSNQQGWSGPSTLGNTTFLPGSRVSLV